VQKGETDKLNTGMGAFVHFGYEVSKNMSVALSLGLAITNTQNVIQYYLGPSFALGNSKKIFMTIGGTLGKFKGLRGYNENDVFIGNASDIPTEPVSKLGWFFGISYNFLSSKKEEKKKE
jgi:hypothetical protein